jgi:hypothetical protein
MSTEEEHIVRVLCDSPEPLFPSEIAERLNGELGSGAAYTTTEVVTRLIGLGDRVAQLPDGGWALKQRT